MDNPFKDNPLTKLSKPQRIAVIAGTVGIGGFFVWDHHKKTGSWNPWSAATPSDSSGNSGSAIDPVTNLPYSEDNQTDSITGLGYLAEANQFGSVQAAEASVSAYGQSTASGSGIPVNPASPTSAGSPNTVVGTTEYTSNSAWSQAATSGLESISGTNTYDGVDIGSALADYLTATPVTPDQAQVIRVALAEYGNPPVGTFQIIPATTTTTGTTTTTSTKPSITAGKVISVSATHAVVAWQGINAVKYQVKITGPGKINNQTNTVTEPQATYEGLEGGHNYTVWVTPYNSSGVAGPQGRIDLKTTS